MSLLLAICFVLSFDTCQDTSIVDTMRIDSVHNSMDILKFKLRRLQKRMNPKKFNQIKQIENNNEPIN